jgi:dienelactone hydrolase
MTIQPLEYSDGSTSFRAMLAQGDETEGKRPGVLVVHEAWGLGEHAIERARMLAELGYVALAVDLYGDGTQVNDIAEAMTLVGDLKGDPQTLRRRMRAALDALTAVPQVDRSRIGAIGFCFGGTSVLELARSGADVAGVVCFHGMLDTVAPAQAGDIGASILVCTGADDPTIPPEQISAFEDEMRAAGADWQVVRYGGTVHSFTNPAADGSIAPIILYDESSDRRSWTAMRAFFEDVFAR